MITGVVTSFHQAIIRLIVRGPTGHAQAIEAVLDTGAMGLSPCLQPTSRRGYFKWIEAMTRSASSRYFSKW